MTRFVKYQGTGNDFIITRAERVGQVDSDFVRAVCDRHFGIGADGMIFAIPGGDDEDVVMGFVNGDGTPGKMCGNGVRCLAAFARDEGLVSGPTVRIRTASGLREAQYLDATNVRVNMQAPIFEPARVPVRWDGGVAIDARFEVDGKEYQASCLSLGNSHAVLFVDDVDTAPVTTLGPRLEFHEMLPERANIEFIAPEREDRVRMRVWELGAGETMSCGSGACAAAIVTRLIRGGAEETVVILPGGELIVEWTGSLEVEAPAWLTGPAERVFEGQL